MNAREFLEASFGQGNIPTWLLEVIPPDAAPLSVLSAGLVGVSRCMFGSARLVFDVLKVSW